MRYNILFKIAVSILAIAISACGSSNSKKNEATSDSSKLSGSETNADPSLEYQSVLKAQDSTMADFQWPRKHEIDLNDDGQKEVFLATSGYSRGADYALYTKEKEVWKNITGAETVAGSHNEIVKLDAKNKGWHDFKTLQASGRDGMIVSDYTWDGSKYVLKDQKEVSMDDLK